GFSTAQRWRRSRSPVPPARSSSWRASSRASCRPSRPAPLPARPARTGAGPCGCACGPRNRYALAPRCPFEGAWPMNRTPSPAGPQPWYQGVSRYQWLVLGLASAGWVFDVYEGQIFNIPRDQLLKDVLPPESDQAAIQYYGDLFLGVFLVGGALGGVLFGAL